MTNSWHPELEPDPNDPYINLTDEERAQRIAKANALLLQSDLERIENGMSPDQVALLGALEQQLVDDFMENYVKPPLVYDPDTWEKRGDGL